MAGSPASTDGARQHHLANFVREPLILINMAWPRTPDAAWYMNYAMVLSTAIVIGLGLVYMWIGKPYDHGKAPAGDAWKVSR